MLLNADDCKDPRDCWSKISFLCPLRFLILNDSILTDRFMGCKNFTFKLFTKERRNSSEFSEMFDLVSGMDWFLYDIGLRLERVKYLIQNYVD